MRSCQTAPARITVTPWLSRCMTGERLSLAPTVLPEGEWTRIDLPVPPLSGDQAHEIGWRIEIDPAERPWTFGRVYIDDVSVTGPMDYAIDTALQRTEFGQVTPFSFNDAEGAVENGELRFSTRGAGQAFTGNYYMRDTAAEASVTPESGPACLLLRGQGCRRYYELGFAGGDRVCIARWEDGARTELATAALPRAACRLRAEARGDRLTLSVNGERVLEARDGRYAYGMTGVCHSGGGVSRWSDFHIAATV